MMEEYCRIDHPLPLEGIPVDLNSSSLSDQWYGKAVERIRTGVAFPATPAVLEDCDVEAYYVKTWGLQPSNLVGCVED